MRRTSITHATLGIGVLLAPLPALAVLDIEDRGPVLRAGNFALRVTNAGIIGNAYYDVGLSTDPSFEFPAYSGRECLNYAALWVGAVDEHGDRRVSGGPLLEWRPTLAPEDRVMSVTHDRPGNQRLQDDDGDGRVDEEVLNGRDDDGDGEIDEDLGIFAQQVLAADYTDDRPEAAYVSSGFETHRALGLAVHQEVYGWALPGYDAAAGLQFRITNHGAQTLKDVRVGLFADLDSRLRSDRTGHLNDRVVDAQYSRAIFEGISTVTVTGTAFTKACYARLGQTLPVVADDARGPHLPVVAVVPLGHTTDPLGFIYPAAARAPGRVEFRSSVFANGFPPGAGGPPIIDADRYRALAGELPTAASRDRGDYVVLVSCGPFATLAPGESIDFDAALVAAETVDSLALMMGNADFLHHGFTLNLLPDSTHQEDSREWHVGETGINGHEVCVEPPAGVHFIKDPNCPFKFFDYEGALEPIFGTGIYELEYRHGHCIWTDADCEACTGRTGEDSTVRWLDPGDVPPAPGQRALPGVHENIIEWDNLPEILARAGKLGPAGSRFVAYRVYKLADWRHREDLLPPRENWSLLRSFGFDTTKGGKLLSGITDSLLDYERILYGQKVYPVGRYRITDPKVLNGFDYVYAVTAVIEFDTQVGNYVRAARLEGPLMASFDRRVVPFAAASDRPGVWVVPNPFRVGAQWDRPPVRGEAQTRHLDFMGLPHARCTIKVWTLAGDLVAVIDHDGSAGNGQASWDLISRNGQDVASGIYLFTVESRLGMDRGRFIVIR